jgi:HEAT repeat protein
MHLLSLANERSRFVAFLLCLVLSGLPLRSAKSTSGQTRSSTPAQAEIERQRQRLASTDPEERRDALMNLGAMHRAAASREAVGGLSDPSPMVRAVAAKAVLSMSSDESVAALLPLISDKDEFVRREVAYALGLTKSRKATEPLIGLLLNDKQDGVRAAAAVSLGEIADERGVVALANVLAPESGAASQLKRKIKRERNAFVLRASARSLGRIKSRAGVPALVAALSNETLVGDVRREAAWALGVIGDPAAVPALRLAVSSHDPYLSQAAYESLQKLTP